LGILAGLWSVVESNFSWKTTRSYGSQA